MKIIVYYLLLLVFIALFSGFILQRQGDSMTMSQMVSASVLLGLYVAGMSLAGEGKTIDEREVSHRYLANRQALLAGTVILSVGVLYQLFFHRLDYWLLASLMVINLVKIISLIYSSYKK